MNFWPYHSFEIETPLSVNEIVAALNSDTEPFKWPRWPFLAPEHHTFQGVVSMEGFKIYRIPDYRNSFLPIMHGSYREGQHGTVVSVRMKLHPFTASLMCFMYCLASAGVLICVIASIIVGNAKVLLEGFPLVALSILFILWAVSNAFFGCEVKATRPVLESILLGSRKSGG